MIMLQMEAMVRATYGRFAGDRQTPADDTTGTGNRKPAKVAVAGCDARAGSWVLELRKPAAPVVRLVARRKAANSYFKVRTWSAVEEKLCTLL
jgi:hypothetical protein